MIADGTLLWQTYHTPIKNFIGATIGKRHKKLNFLKEDYSVMTKHPSHVKHEKNNKVRK
jgi:hypothetical protein